MNWYPFRSKDVAEICQHLTPEEREHLRSLATSHGLKMGFAIGISVVTANLITSNFIPELPKSLLILWSFFSGLLVASAVGFIAGRRMRLKIKEMLCSTRYAKQKGFSANNLKMYSF